MTTLFLFDLDGTLLRTGGAGLRSLDRTFQELYGINFVLQQINPSGKTDPAIFREIIQRFLSRDMRPDEGDVITTTYLKYLSIEIQISSGYRVLPGVEEVLGALRTQSHALVGLGTGNMEKGARIKLAPANLNPYFSFGGFGSDAEDRAELLKIAHRRAEEIRNDNIHSEKTFVIGDTPLDIKAAQRAGFRSVAVATGLTSFDDLKKGAPDYVFNDLTEGFGLLTSL